MNGDETDTKNRCAWLNRDECMHQFGIIESSLASQAKEMSIRFDMLTKLFETRLISSERAIEVASGIMEKRLESMNEFRDTLKDQASTFITRTESEAKRDQIAHDVESLKRSFAMMEGKASQKTMNMTMFISITGVLMSVFGLLHDAW